MATRASNGESTIYKGADGRWHGYVSVGFTLAGKLDRRHVSSKSRGVVVTKVRELERQRDTGTVSETSTPTVAWWLEHWLTTIAPRRVRQRTLESYESAVRKHLIPGVGRHRLDRLRPEHLDQLYTALLDAGYSPATVLRHHRLLSRALTVAMQRGHVARNVAGLVDPPAQKQSDLATALDLGEARAVLGAAAHVRNSARWTVALALGLRQSEALALQWKDIDLLTGTLTVRRSIHRVRGGLIYEEPKTRRSQRTLALPLPLVGALHEHRARQLGERMLAGSEWHDEDLVFAQPNGRPIDKKTDYDDWTRLLHKAGVRHVRLHDGRHTAATLLLSENVHPRVVMELLGHSQMRTTMDIYSHVMPALAREAADRMSALLLPGKGGQTATTTATRDDSGRSPEGERPGHRGGAEGTRTPDPHTASVVRYQLRHSPARPVPVRPDRGRLYRPRPGGPCRGRLRCRRRARPATAPGRCACRPSRPGAPRSAGAVRSTARGCRAGRSSRRPPRTGRAPPGWSPCGRRR
ncbi:Site-specific recombinase XerD [Geodermatophilus pulveris]|uniref:Site-specific recombinase XerD n=1 Tax=Geodermatophilus pulveris TaxID=1564159 RepID=A0A239DJ12_9ACTN|nr:Site-specific recombinase XerD [Geodermatophilus pulveris]